MSGKHSAGGFALVALLAVLIPPSPATAQQPSPLTARGKTPAIEGRVETRQR